MRVPSRSHQTDCLSPLEICLKLTKVSYKAEEAEDREGRKVGVIRSIPVESVIAFAWNRVIWAQP